MKMWATLLKVVGYIWCIFGGLFILVGFGGVWILEGFSGIQRLLSIFNISNWIITIIMLAPGIGSLILADKIKEKLNYSAQT